MSMAMTWALIKKDFLLAKRFAPLVLGIGIILPIFIAIQTPEVGSIGIFLFMTLYSELILGQYVTATENKFAKAEALLFATPYTRKSFVLAKYLFLLIVFAGCLLLYFAMSLIPATGIVFGLDAVVATLLIISIVCGILLPVQLKLGVEKTRFVFLVVLFGVSFGAPAVLPYLTGLNISGLAALPGWLYATGAVIIAAICLVISARASIKVYEMKEM